MKRWALLPAAIFIIILQACEYSTPPQQVVFRVEKPALKKDSIPISKVSSVNHDTISITAVGDIMMGTSYPSGVTLPPDSGKDSFKAVAKYLNNSDITFGNLEGTLLDSGMPAHYKLHLKTAAYMFRMPQNYSRILKDAGFNALSLANNHSGDFSDAGRISTTRVLDSCGINYAGLLTHPSSTFNINGVTYGFCGFSPNSNTVSILELKRVSRIIQQLKDQSDIVIVAFHGGCEGAAYEHVPDSMESFFGEKRGHVRLFAHTAIDAGADIVLGTGPHVSRALELYKDRIIAYSLGNFCTYRSVSVSGVCGIAPILKIKLNKKGEFLKGNIIAVKQTRLYGLEPDTSNGAIKRIQWLTKTDFPQSGLVIGDDGVIGRN